MIDIFRLTKSKTLQTIFTTFLGQPEKDFYLRELERNTHISAGNLRRELSQLLKIGLFKTYKQGKNIYYQIDKTSPYYKIIDQTSANRDLIAVSFTWVKNKLPLPIPDEYFCTTRDVFQARLETQLNHWESDIGADAYLLTAIVGEIANNSFDHNLGNWPDIPGIFFACETNKKLIVLADRGQGVLKTIRFVKPEVENDKEALNVAFTQIISGRKDEHRGNGLKFVKNTVLENNWRLQFYSDSASAEIRSSLKSGVLKIKFHPHIQGCLAVIKY